MTAKFTGAEREVFEYMIKGLTNEQIATARFITEKGVKNHVTSIFKKSGCASRAELLAKHYMAELVRVRDEAYKAGAADARAGMGLPRGA